MHIAELSQGSNGLTYVQSSSTTPGTCGLGQSLNLMPPPSSASTWSQGADLLQEVGASWNESTTWRLHDFTSSEVFSWPYHPGNYFIFLNLGLSQILSYPRGYLDLLGDTSVSFSPVIRPSNTKWSLFKLHGYPQVCSIFFFVLIYVYSCLLNTSPFPFVLTEFQIKTSFSPSGNALTGS